MKKNTKIIVWSAVGLAVAVGAFFGIRSLVKKAKARKSLIDPPKISDDIKKDTVINAGVYATKEDALDLIDKAKKKDEQRQASAQNGLTVEKSWITKIDSNPNWLQEYLETFIDSKVLKAEYATVLQVLTEFEKNEPETLKKLDPVSMELLKSFDKKFTKLKQKINRPLTQTLTQAQANAIAYSIFKLNKQGVSPAILNKTKELTARLEKSGYSYQNGKAVKNVG